MSSISPAPHLTHLTGPHGRQGTPKSSLASEAASLGTTADAPQVEEPQADEEELQPEGDAGQEGQGDDGEGQYFFGEDDPSVRPSPQSKAELEKAEEGYAHKWLAGGVARRQQGEGEEEEEQDERPYDEEEDDGEEYYDEDKQEPPTSHVMLHKFRLQLGEDHTVAQALSTLDFWLLYGGLVGGFGAGLTAVANLAQIAQAQGGAPVHVLTSLISVAQFLGRLAGGAVSEHLVRDMALPRPASLAAIQLIMLPGHLAFAWAFPGCVYLGSVVVGACYGAICAVTPTVAGELFGLQSLGMLYNCLLAAAPLGSYLCSGLLAGYLYEREVEREHPHLSVDRMPIRLPAASRWITDGRQVCHGAHCFRLIFILMMVVCVIGASLHLVAAARTRQLYAMIKARHDAENAHHDQAQRVE